MYVVVHPLKLGSPKKHTWVALITTSGLISNSNYFEKANPQSSMPLFDSGLRL